MSARGPHEREEPPAAPRPAPWRRLAAWARAKDATYLGYFAGRVGAAIGGFFAVRALVRVLPPAEYAAWGAYAAVAAAIVPLATVSLPAAMMRLWFDHPAGASPAKVQLATSTLVLIAGAAAAVVCYGVAAGALGWHAPSLALHIAAVASALCLLSYSNYLNRILNRPALFVVTQVGDRLGLVAALTLAAQLWPRDAAGWPGGDRLGTVIGLYAAVLWALVTVNLLAFGAAGLIARGQATLPGGQTTAMLRFSGPLSVTYLLGWLLSSSPIYLLHRLVPAADVALYVFAVGLVALVDLVTQAALTDWPRFFYAKMRDGGDDRDRAITARVRLFLWIHVGAMLLLRLIATPVYELYGAATYLPGRPLLGWLVLGNFFFLAGNLFTAGIGLAKRTGWTIVVFAIPGALQLGLNLTLLPGGGPQTAATVGALSFAVFAAVGWWVGARFYRISHGVTLLPPMALALLVGIAPW